MRTLMGPMSAGCSSTWACSMPLRTRVRNCTPRPLPNAGLSTAGGELHPRLGHRPVEGVPVSAAGGWSGLAASMRGLRVGHAGGAPAMPPTVGRRRGLRGDGDIDVPMAMPSAAPGRPRPSDLRLRLLASARMGRSTRRRLALPVDPAEPAPRDASARASEDAGTGGLEVGVLPRRPMAARLDAMVGPCPGIARRPRAKTPCPPAEPPCRG